MAKPYQQPRQRCLERAVSDLLQRQMHELGIGGTIRGPPSTGVVAVPLDDDMIEGGGGLRKRVSLMQKRRRRGRRRCPGMKGMS